MDKCFSPRTAGVIVAFVFGFLFMLVGLDEWDDAALFQDAPQKLACGDLARRGPEANNHVTLTEFRPCRSGYAFYETKKNGVWDRVYIPVYSAGENGEPDARKLRVIVKLVGVRNEAQMWRTLFLPELTGVISARGDELWAPRKVLAEQYPGMDFSGCWVLNVGGRHPNTRAAVLLVGAGVASTALGLVYLALLVFDLFRREEKPQPPRGDPRLKAVLTGRV